ncbi:hypothetical protein [Tomitella fengzijianii]|uniref:Tetratricopeptide repeat protein n=1 Tax=Tomitella fengzijianii TaxID=2597660 RepID=A0A516X891_9ACTN|nr:hypothetical protein [Tomitella fengzijianii]QDQ99243.1 hypothetical protein FO059_10395 [Tomitella fengzijianii]
MIVVALAVYFVVLGQRAVQLISDGGAGMVVLGVAVLILPLMGVWMIYSTLRSAFAHDRLARRIAGEGLELDTGGLPRRPSGRFERDAADELFAEIKTEWESDPDDWRCNYRLARAYDVAGDRKRAREIMKRAVALEGLERKAGEAGESAGPPPGHSPG